MTRTTLRATVRPLLAINLLSFAAQVVQIGTLPPLMALRLSQAQEPAPMVGIVAGAPWVAILLLGSFVPRVLKRHGFLATNAAAAIVSLLAVVGMISTHDPLLLFPLNFIFGVGLIMRWVACDTWIVSVAAPETRGRAIGVHETLMGCGIAAGPLVLASVGVEGTLPFLVCALLLAVSAATLIFLVGSDGRPDVPARGAGVAVARLVPTAIVAAFVAGFVETAAVSFLPVYGEQHFFAATATTVLVGFGVGGTTLQVPLGWLADRIGCTAAQTLSAGTVALGSMSLPFVAAHPAALLIVLFLWGGAVGGMNTLAVMEAGQKVSDGHVSTAMMSVAMSYTVGSMLGPVVTGFTTNWLSSRGLSLAGLVTSVGFIAVRIFSARKPPSPSPVSSTE